MNEFNPTEPQVPVTDSPVIEEPIAAPAVTDGAPEAVPAEAPEVPAPPVDPRRSAAGRLGGQRVHRLAELGRIYEQEHGLKPGRQRLKQLIQLGRRYEQEHGLAAPRPRRKKKGDAWAEFLTALARVVKPAYRPAVEQLVATLRPGPKGIAA